MLAIIANSHPLENLLCGVGFLSLLYLAICKLYTSFVHQYRYYTIIYDRDIIDSCKLLVKKFCDDNTIPSDHGYTHALFVMTNAVKAFGYMKVPISFDDATCILLACLLHDVDDRKNVRPNSPPYSNMRVILGQLNVDDKMITRIIVMISLVSASSNGNNECPPQYPLWYMIPRDCDRLEAVGMVGIRRSYEFSYRNDIPLIVPGTPLCTDYTELKKIISERPFDKYVKGESGKCLSVIDQYWDRLVHLECIRSGNEYLTRVMTLRYAESLKYIFNTCQFLKFIDINKTGPIFLKGGLLYG